MIGLGIDLCEISRIEAAMAKSDGFLLRYYAAEEREYLTQRGLAMAQSAAAMFAAKEAFLKALGTGLSGGVAMAEVCVTHDALGRPGYRLAEKALAAMQAAGAQKAFLSLTHDAGMAAAVCILE